MRLRYEHRTHPLAPIPRFLRRLLLSFLLGFSLILLSLGVGMWGYHHFEGMAWLDAFLNAAMLLSGMGPLTAPVTDGGKFFAGCYALYSGIAVIAFAGIAFAPLIHRFFHALDCDSRD